MKTCSQIHTVDDASTGYEAARKITSKFQFLADVKIPNLRIKCQCSDPLIMLHNSHHL